MEVPGWRAAGDRNHRVARVRSVVSAPTAVPNGTKGGIVNLRQILLGIAISAGLTLATVSHAQNWHSKKFRTPTSTSADTTAPTTPSGLAASALTSTSLTLSWNASTDNVGVTGYQVYRNGTLVASPGGTSASISGLSASTPYSFTVSALDAAGNVSALSAPVSVTTPAPTAAPTPDFSADFLGVTFPGGDGSYSSPNPPSTWYVQQAANGRASVIDAPGGVGGKSLSLHTEPGDLVSFGGPPRADVSLAMPGSLPGQTWQVTQTMAAGS